MRTFLAPVLALDMDVSMSLGPQSPQAPYGSPSEWRTQPVILIALHDVHP